MSIIPILSKYSSKIRLKKTTKRMTETSTKIKSKKITNLFYQYFLSRTLRTHRTAGEWRSSYLIHPTSSIRSQTLRHLFANLHVTWLSHIFNRTACIYQTATRWDLSPYWITIWLIEDVRFIFVCLFILFEKYLP